MVTFRVDLTSLDQRCRGECGSCRVRGRFQKGLSANLGRGNFTSLSPCSFCGRGGGWSVSPRSRGELFCPRVKEDLQELSLL